jgi:hypothetical protein
MTEARLPQNWYAIVSSDELSMKAYLDHYRAMDDPALQPMPSEGPNCAKLISTTFAGLVDYEQVLTEARELTEIMTGAMKVLQGPANLVLENVSGEYPDGKIEKFPPHGRPVGLYFGRPIRTFGGQVKETFEKSVTLFALRAKNPYVREVLREFARSDDWVNLYRIMEIIILDLNENDPSHKRDGRAKIDRLGWVAETELNSFYTTIDSYRHRRAQRCLGQ